MSKVVEAKEKQTLPPVKWNTWVLLKNYCLQRTAQEGRLVTISEVVEKAIFELTANTNMKSKEVN